MPTSAATPNSINLATGFTAVLLLASARGEAGADGRLLTIPLRSRKRRGRAAAQSAGGRALDLSIAAIACSSGSDR